VVQSMTGGRVREHVAQLDVPPEPPVGSVVMSTAEGVARQSVDTGNGTRYPRTGDMFGFSAFSWPQLLGYGPVLVLWRPDADMPDQSTRGAAFDLLAALDTGGATLADVEVRDAIRRLRSHLVGEQATEASGAPG